MAMNQSEHYQLIDQVISLENDFNVPTCGMSNVMVSSAHQNISMMQSNSMSPTGGALALDSTGQQVDLMQNDSLNSMGRDQHLRQMHQQNHAGNLNCVMSDCIDANYCSTNDQLLNGDNSLACMMGYEKHDASGLTSLQTELEEEEEEVETIRKELVECDQQQQQQQQQQQYSPMMRHIVTAPNYQQQQYQQIPRTNQQIQQTLHVANMISDQDQQQQQQQRYQTVPMQRINNNQQQQLHAPMPTYTETPNNHIVTYVPVSTTTTSQHRQQTYGQAQNITWITSQQHQEPTAHMATNGLMSQLETGVNNTNGWHTTALVNNANARQQQNYLQQQQRLQINHHQNHLQHHQANPMQQQQIYQLPSGRQQIVTTISQHPQQQRHQHNTTNNNNNQLARPQQQQQQQPLSNYQIQSVPQMVPTIQGSQVIPVAPQSIATNSSTTIIATGCNGVQLMPIVTTAMASKTNTETTTTPSTLISPPPPPSPVAPLQQPSNLTGSIYLDDNLTVLKLPPQTPVSGQLGQTTTSTGTIASASGGQFSSNENALLSKQTGGGQQANCMSSPVYLEMSSSGSLSSEWLDKICRQLVEHMNHFGICVMDNFLGSITADKILNEVQRLYSSGQYTKGRLVNKAKLDEDGTAASGGQAPLDTGSDASQSVAINPTRDHHENSTSSVEAAIRSDRVIWVDGCEQGCSEISNLIQTLCSVISHSSRLSLYSNNGLDKVIINKRTKAHVACYPGNGTRYIKHVDNPNGDGRVITAIYYLNKDWNTKRDGGLLRMFPAGMDTVANIEPLFDRVLFFWSDRRNPHEVLPAYRDRFAITVWYIGENRQIEQSSL